MFFYKGRAIQYVENLASFESSIFSASFGKSQITPGPSPSAGNIDLVLESKNIGSGAGRMHGSQVEDFMIK